MDDYVRVHREGAWERLRPELQERLVAMAAEGVEVQIVQTHPDAGVEGGRVSPPPTVPVPGWTTERVALDPQTGRSVDVLVPVIPPPAPAVWRRMPAAVLERLDGETVQVRVDGRREVRGTVRVRRGEGIQIVSDEGWPPEPLDPTARIAVRRWTPRPEDVPDGLVPETRCLLETRDAERTLCGLPSWHAKAHYEAGVAVRLCPRCQRRMQARLVAGEGEASGAHG